MRRTFVALLFVIALIVTLIGCGGGEAVEKQQVTGTVVSVNVIQLPNASYMTMANMYFFSGNLGLHAMHLALAHNNPDYYYYATFVVEGYEGTHKFQLDSKKEIGAEIKLILNKVYKDGKLVKTYLTL